MLMTRFVVSMFSVGMVLGAGAAFGQAYPNKPLRIVAAQPGSGSDIAVRLIVPGLSARLGQPIVVDNRGGNVAIGGEIVWKAAPDGYTLLVNGGTLWPAALLQKTPYDPVRDFAPIAILTRSPTVLVVHPSLPVTSVKELIALAKARPGELNYASAVQGSQYAGELFKAMAGVNIVNIPYKGGGSAVNAVIGGEVRLYFGPATVVAPHIQSGRLRGLAVGSAQQSALAPGLPTVAAAGLPGYEAGSIIGMFAPAKTPEMIISRLNREIVQILNQPDMKEKIFNAGTEIVGSSPAEFAAKIRDDMASMRKVLCGGQIACPGR